MFKHLLKTDTHYTIFFEAVDAFILHCMLLINLYYSSCFSNFSCIFRLSLTQIIRGSLYLYYLSDPRFIWYRYISLECIGSALGLG